ncbi:Uncharacterized protein Adt_04560 [Abeliophyllum distichum]|uniref:Uncharacterized protein n=1 Tax=Abeliophyllum distichum TaxID=126358 RepID=A0ABD1V1L5_9LAMI
MNIIYTYFPSPTSISLSTIKLVTKDISLRPYILSATRQNVSRKRDLTLQAFEFSCPPIDADCLASEFGVDGVTFSAVSEGENDGAVIQGGISLAFNCQNDRGGSWSPNIWALHQVKGTPQESIQVELISRNSECNVEVRHVINLQQDVLISEILVSNASTSALRLMGSFISHLTGRRNSVVVRRDGFNELYMFSPGSRHKWYGKYSYICLGQAALLQPISLNSQSEWRGGQHLHNPNF